MKDCDSYEFPDTDPVLETDSDGAWHISPGRGQVCVSPGIRQVIVHPDQSQVIIMPGLGQVIAELGRQESSHRPPVRRHAYGRPSHISKVVLSTVQLALHGERYL